jgi:tetratricopeptide (TPR) repeat protein
MTSDCPRSRRKFNHEWNAIEYLYHKVLYWYYRRHDRAKALRFCNRLEKLLQRTSSVHEAILGQAAWSLVYDLKGDLPKAIQHREREIKLIRRLWDISRGTPGEALVFQQHDASDLSDRYDLLAILYHDAGNLNKAIRVLRESEQLCKEHRVRFDGKDLLRDYFAEKKPLPPPRALRKRRSSA